RYTLRWASGNTTLPISRPLTTADTPSTARRCTGRSAILTAGTAATGDTARSTASVRSCHVASTPPTITSRSRPSATLGRPTRTSILAARVASASVSVAAMPRCCASQVTARYRIPVSKNTQPRRSARRWPTVVLPAAAGPSSAMIDPATLLLQDPARLGRRELPPVAAREIAEGQRAHADPDKPIDRVPYRR